MTGRATLVLPAYDERERIATALRMVADWRATKPGGWEWEVIVVDDGSSDGTKELARRAAEEAGLPVEILRHETNRGKGAAIRTGILASSGDPVLISDTDLSTPLTEWVKLAERLSTHPVAIGSRALKGSLVRRKQPLYRRLAGKLGNKLIRLLAVRGIRDTQCGFKLFRGGLAREIFGEVRIDRFAYDIEVLYLAQKRGVPIAEVPVLWFNSPDSRVSFPRDLLQTFWDLLRIRWIHRNRGQR